MNNRFVEIRFFQPIEKEELRNSVFITGYPGFGLVGLLASKHIVSEIGLKKIGFIATRYMMEVTYYSNKLGIVYPFELYFGKVKDRKILVLLNHTIPHDRERTIYVDTICKWLKNTGISSSILIGGLDPRVKESETETFRWLPFSGFKGEINAPKLVEKYIVGPLALTLLFLNAYEIPGVVILAYAEMYRPDPRASAVAVKVVSQLLGLEIDTKKLLEEASIIEALEEEKERILEAIESESGGAKRGYSIHV
uniref:Proteasome assembly chaperone family protein n=1 Tax=Staphylothermus marinus TaxID=2280 RepID=A0A7J3KF71_STAMA